MKTRKALMEEIEKLKEENETLKEDNKRLIDIVSKTEEAAIDLQEQLEKINRGERFEGSHCEGCVHAIKVRLNTLVTTDGYYIGPGAHEIACALSVPCPDFQRKEE